MLNALGNFVIVNLVFGKILIILVNIIMLLGKCSMS